MKTIIYVAIFLTVSAVTVSAEVFLQSTFTVAGTNYVSAVSDADLKKAPVWIQVNEHPPLSPRRAIQVAQGTVTNLFKGITTIVDSVSLHPVGRESKWVYQVQFTTIPPGGLDGDSAPIKLFVLMNGEVILPKPEMPKQSAGGAALDAILSRSENWMATEQPSDATWNALVEAAILLQSADPAKVSTILNDYQNSMASDPKRDFLASLNLFLLLRVTFELPENAESKDENPRFAPWVPRSLANADGTDNLAWPIRWNDGVPVLISNGASFDSIAPQGEKIYDAGLEFEFFRKKYSYRNLSAFNKERKSVK